MITRRAFVAAAAILIVLAHPSAQVFSSREPAPAAQTRPAEGWRPTVVAQHGMVAAGHPLAAEAGLRILKAGGNAVDAAIATWAVQGEVEPGMTGLGADMFVLIYLAKTGEVKFINGPASRRRRRRSISTNRRAAFPSRDRCRSRCRVRWAAPRSP
jgi:gamma-glutamyltranspeptidase/glutathione hydrolase